MGCCVVCKEDQAEKPIAMVIASASAYRADVRRSTELNWRRTNAYREKEDQWCLDYLVRNTLSLYTTVGFLVTSLDSDKNPIMLLQVHDIGQRAHRKVVDTLISRHGAAAAEQGGGGNGSGEGGGDGGGGGGDGHCARRLRRRVRRGGVQPARRGVLVNMENLTFRMIEDHLTPLNGQACLASAGRTGKRHDAPPVVNVGQDGVESISAILPHSLERSQAVPPYCVTKVASRFQMDCRAETREQREPGIEQAVCCFSCQ
ncbi:Hypothetical predicted protein [Paramuricea clavata]|uniref:Uncharacterized protein n=1 Tax=Paramuricea clavata TaxID=317549 RepID=A0A7D9DCP7_PARCT|nr:Hypothetical predicted protein [Paramuricea clavata]